MSRKKTQKEFIEEMKVKHPTIEVVGTYDGNKKKIAFRCKKDGYQWETKPNTILALSRGCPFCGNKAVIRGVNDVATTFPEYLPYFAIPQEAYTHSQGSGYKALMRCPHCGAERRYRIADLKEHGFSCPMCSSGVSFPNKFSRAMLRQLPIQNLITEYCPDWANQKQYDNYFEYDGQKIILEMDGEQHYRQAYKNGKSLSEIQAIDELKDRLAAEHGITLIRIDSKQSTMRYLRDNILKSKLAEIIDLSNIDWVKCNEEATDGLVKEVCDYFEAHKNTELKSEMIRDLNMKRTTFERYIDYGEVNGWCVDDCRKYSIKNNEGE